MSEDALSSEVDAATKMITETAAQGVEVILGTAFKEDLNDEMIITVIAAGYEDNAATVPVEEPIAISNPLVEGFTAVEPRKPAAQKPSSAIPRLDDDDDLSEIFKILDKK